MEPHRDETEVQCICTLLFLFLLYNLINFTWHLLWWRAKEQIRITLPQKEKCVYPSCVAHHSCKASREDSTAGANVQSFGSLIKLVMQKLQGVSMLGKEGTQRHHRVNTLSAVGPTWVHCDFSPLLFWVLWFPQHWVMDRIILSHIYKHSTFLNMGYHSDAHYLHKEFSFQNKGTDFVHHPAS